MASFYTLCGHCERCLPPFGTNIGPLQFDATIQLDPPLAPLHVIVFARYWVGRDYYRIAIIWAEPHASRLWFPVYPPTLSIGSDAESFIITSQLYPANNSDYQMPLSERGVFRNMFGDYPIKNIRFADREARSQRLYSSDLSDLDLTQGNVTVPLSARGRAPEMEPASIEVAWQKDLVKSITLFTKNQRLLKRILYEYDKSNSPPHLVRQEVFVAERVLTNGFPNGGVTIKIANTNYTFKDFAGVHEPGGRVCTVDYS